MSRNIQLKYRLETAEYVGSFRSMASPCEIIIQTSSETVASSICNIAYDEASRIEQKYSRYNDDSLISKIHKHQPLQVDEETARLLDFSKSAYSLSDGRFDITSGVLRKLWDFSAPESSAPSRAKIKALMKHIGWDKVSWNGSHIHLPEGMQIDFGGFGKEYAVDSALNLVNQSFDCPVLLNFGGDLAANKKPLSRDEWSVGVRSDSGKSASFRFESGAIATSGNKYRFINYKGKKLSHILNPRTGWPVSNAPKSVSVAMTTCLQAGFLSTLASLMGKDAEKFLEAQEIQFWVQR